MNNAYVYLHIRLDINEVFYVGIGTKIRGINDYQRANRKSRRSNIWNYVFNKTEYKVLIIQDNITWLEACNIEINLIKQYGRKDLGHGSLVNLTDGGEGNSGKIMSSEQKIKIGLANKGKVRTELDKLKNRIGHLGKKASIETKTKLSISSKSRTHSDETKALIASIRTGKKHTQASRLKMSQSQIGKKKSEAAKAKKRKVIVDTVTNENYASITDAALKNNIAYKYLSNMLTGYAKNSTNLKYA